MVWTLVPENLPGGSKSNTSNIKPPSFDNGCGISVALFASTFSIQYLVALLRAQSRVVHIVSEQHMRNVPLLVISNIHSVCIFKEALQQQLSKWVTHKVNPFQNPILVTSLRFGDSKEAALVQKQQELLDLNQNCQEALSSKGFCWCWVDSESETRVS